MTLDNIMQPFVLIIEWLRNTTFYLGEYPFTFWDFFIWQLLAGIVISFITKFR